MINKKNIFLFFKKINYNCEDENDGKNYRYFHALRVLTLAQKIMQEKKIMPRVNPDLLWVLALFHDIGHNTKLLNEEQTNSNDKTKDIHNSQLFEKYIYPLIDNKDLVRQLIVAVRDFSEKEYKNIESRIVKDADDLDEIGILNFWRMGVFAGKHNQDPQEVIDFFYQHDLLNKQQKIDKLFFDFSKKTAEKRILEMNKIMDDFRDLNQNNSIY